MGELREVRQEPIVTDLSRGLGPIVEAKVLAQMQTVQAELDVQERPISVTFFSIPELHIALKQFPDDLEEYLTDPSRFSDEVQCYESNIREWLSDQMCVLVWGSRYNHFFLNRDGIRV
jgi:hypothetical protein